jgi:putative membrane protein
MRTRLLLLSAAAAASLALAGCGERNEPVEDGPIEAASAGSGVGSNPASNAVQDTASAAVGATSAATLGRTTEGFVTNASVSNLYEIESGRIAGERAKNPALKSFGQQIVKDHTAMMAEMKAAAPAAGNVTMPTVMDERRQGMIENLRQAPEEAFDGVFRAQQVAAHEESLTLHRTYAENGDNAQLKALAAKGAPMIQAHLEMIRAVPESGSGQPGAPGQTGAD